MPTYQTNVEAVSGKLVQRGGSSDPTLYQGRLNSIPSIYTHSVLLQAGDIIELCRVPAGATIDPLNSFAFVTAVPITGGSPALTIKIGWDDDDDGIMVASSFMAAGRIECVTATSIPATATTPTRLAKEKLIYATVATVAGTTAVTTAKFIFSVAYRTA